MAFGPGLGSDIGESIDRGIAGGGDMAGGGMEQFDFDRFVDEFNNPEGDPFDGLFDQPGMIDSVFGSNTALGIKGFNFLGAPAGLSARPAMRNGELGFSVEFSPAMLGLRAAGLPGSLSGMFPGFEIGFGSLEEAGPMSAGEGGGFAEGMAAAGITGGIASDLGGASPAPSSMKSLSLDQEPVEKNVLFGLVAPLKGKPKDDELKFLENLMMSDIAAGRKTTLPGGGGIW